MEYRAVIFDLDGTLADTLEDIGDTMNRILASCGYPAHSYHAYRFMVGGGLRNLVTQSLPEQARTEQIIEECHARMRADYEQCYIKKTRLYDGIAETLNALSLWNVKLAVLSNKANAITQKICSALLQDRPFKIILGADERFPLKPDPQSTLFIAGRLGLSSAEVCYLGDSNVDMQTARAAGCYAVGAGWGFRPKEELLQSGAQLVIDYPTELLSLF
ncbi:MAG: HAD family hydrolase [Bacteroidales bacterium]|jgi:phosphoglycolate phosphatase|nr:HAD family hydrolase [Bacteroidales bacterium]